MEIITLGEYIRKIRLQKNLTLDYFELKGISKSQISKIENNNRVPTAETLIKISNILDINVIELYKISGYISDEIIDSYVAYRDKNKK